MKGQLHAGVLFCWISEYVLRALLKTIRHTWPNTFALTHTYVGYCKNDCTLKLNDEMHVKNERIKSYILSKETKTVVVRLHITYGH